MYIYTIKDNDEPATGDVLAFLGSQRNKDVVTYDGGYVNVIHHTGVCPQQLCAPLAWRSPCFLHLTKGE